MLAKSVMSGLNNVRENAKEHTPHNIAQAVVRDRVWPATPKNAKKLLFLMHPTASPPSPQPSFGSTTSDVTIGLFANAGESAQVDPMPLRHDLREEVFDPRLKFALRKALARMPKEHQVAELLHRFTLPSPTDLLLCLSNANDGVLSRDRHVRAIFCMK